MSELKSKSPSGLKTKRIVLKQKSFPSFARHDRSIKSTFCFRAILLGVPFTTKMSRLTALKTVNQRVLYHYRKCNILVIRTSAQQTNALRILWNEALKKGSCLSISQSSEEIRVSTLLAQSNKIQQFGCQRRLFLFAMFIFHVCS